MDGEGEKGIISTRYRLTLNVWEAFSREYVSQYLSGTGIFIKGTRDEMGWFANVNTVLHVLVLKIRTGGTNESKSSKYLL